MLVYWVRKPQQIWIDPFPSNTRNELKEASENGHWPSPMTYQWDPMSWLRPRILKPFTRGSGVMKPWLTMVVARKLEATPIVTSWWHVHACQRCSQTLIVGGSVGLSQVRLHARNDMTGNGSRRYIYRYTECLSISPSLCACMYAYVYIYNTYMLNILCVHVYNIIHNISYVICVTYILYMIIYVYYLQQETQRERERNKQKHRRIYIYIP